MQIDAILYNIINLEHDFKSISNDHKCLSTLNLFTLFILVRKSDRVPSEKEEEKKTDKKNKKAKEKTNIHRRTAKLVRAIEET